MSKTEELLKLMQENLDLPIIPMVGTGIVAEDSSTANPTITELEAMGYTVEQAEKVAGIACSIAQTSGVSMDMVMRAICSVMRTPSPDAEIAMIRLNPSLNIFQKWWRIHKIKKRRNKKWIAKSASTTKRFGKKRKKTENR